MATKEYNPKAIAIIVCGIPIDSGFAEDSMVKLTWDNPKFDDVSGVDGEVTRVRSYDGRALMTLNLMQSSSCNDLLSNLHSRDLVAPGGAGAGAILVQDLQGTTLITAATGWIKGPPETEFGKKPGPRAWEIRMANVKYLVGGALLIGA